MSCKKSACYVKYKKFHDGTVKITSKINPIYNSCVDRTRKEFSTITNARCAIKRAYGNMNDLLYDNAWKFFLTLTFDKNVVDRLDDRQTRKAFSEWQKEVKRKFPNMYYLSVPEYHKAGGLHFHIVVGGVSAEELQLVDSGYVVCYESKNGYISKEKYALLNKPEDSSTGEGMTIYNVNGWTSGFSTATVVRSSAAVANYVSKYLQKADIDVRFYNKKRFYCSRNILRPKVTIEKYVDTAQMRLDKRGEEIEKEFEADFVYGNDRKSFRQYHAASVSPGLWLHLEMKCITDLSELPFNLNARYEE